MAFFGLFGRRRKRVQTSAQRPRRRRPGAAAQRYLERVAELEAVQQRRRAQRTAPQRATRPVRPSDPRYDDPTVPIPKSVQRVAEQRWQARQRAERQDRERQDRERQREERDRLRARQREARQADKLLRQRDRAIEAYVTAGLSRAEAEAMVDRGDPEWEVNPRRRNVRARGQLRRRTNPGPLSARGERLLLDIEAGALPPPELYNGMESNRGGRIRVSRGRGGRYSVTHVYRGLPPVRMATDVDASAARNAAERLYGRTLASDYDALFRAVRRTRGNPGVASLAGEIAKDVLKGSLVAAAQEELKEWRDRRGGFGIVRRAPHRRNPARLEPNHPDPRLRDMSERFHGRPDQILHLDADQRRPPPAHVVMIGQERAMTYRVPRGSERAGADWEHEAGDRGALRRNASGRRILVADERGRVYVLQGSSSMRFDPDRGLVG